MPDFSLKMHKLQFRIWLRPRLRWGVHSAPPDPLAGFLGKGKGKKRVREVAGERGGRGGRDIGSGRRERERGGDGLRKGIYSIELMGIDARPACTTNCRLQSNVLRSRL